MRHIVTVTSRLGSFSHAQVHPSPQGYRDRVRHPSTFQRLRDTVGPSLPDTATRAERSLASDWLAVEDSADTPCLGRRGACVWTFGPGAKRQSTPVDASATPRHAVQSSPHWHPTATTSRRNNPRPTRIRQVNLNTSQLRRDVAAMRINGPAADLNLSYIELLNKLKRTSSSVTILNSNELQVQ